MQGEWLRLGTVAVTEGSPLVTGTAVSWAICDVTVGDFFVGPDEKLYEVVAFYKVGEGPTPFEKERILIRSLSGLDAYQGVTNAAGSYSIIRNWTNTTNATIALKITELFKASVFSPGGGLVRYGITDPPEGDFNDGTLYVKY